MPLLGLLWFSVRLGSTQASEGVSSCSYQGQASLEVLKAIEEDKPPTWQKYGLALCFLCFKDGVSRLTLNSHPPVSISLMLCLEA